jgi:hypothetical protein
MDYLGEWGGGALDTPGAQMARAKECPGPPPPHSGMGFIGESVLVKYLLLRLSELNKI